MYDSTEVNAKRHVFLNHHIRVRWYASILSFVETTFLLNTEMLHTTCVVIQIIAYCTVRQSVIK